MNGEYRTGARKKSGSSLFAGILIGLFLGLGAALGVALWVNRGEGPFKTPPKAPPAPVPEAAAPEETVVPKKPPYTFYGILQGDKTPVPEKAPPENTSPEDSEAATPPEEQSAFYVQAGAFQRPDEAETLRAKLGLAGVQAEIRSVDVPDKGILHRVRAGPYATRAEAERVRTTLMEQGFQAALVRQTSAAESMFSP